MALDLRCRHDESLRLEAARLHDAGLGLSASAPPSRYSLHHCLSGVALAMPKRSIASGLAIPPSTTALAAATLVS